jgi:sulfide:quinone oxidoreductase
MFESTATASVSNIKAAIEGKKPHAKATWDAICLADMRNTGAVFVASPQIPPRNASWMKKGKWVHYAKVSFEKHFIYKMKKGSPEPAFEKYFLKFLGIAETK